MDSIILFQSRALDASHKQQGAAAELKQARPGGLTDGSVTVHVCKSTSESTVGSTYDLICGIKPRRNTFYTLRQR